MNGKEFIERIINKLKRKPKQNLLTGDIDYNYNPEKAFRNRNKISVQEIETQSEKESIEDCILEYMTQYTNQVEIGAKDDISYKALTRMFTTKGEPIGKNVEFQQKLKDKIYKNSKYRIDGQYSSKGKPIFYHISQNSKEGEQITDKDENMYKIYLNCERKNISKLTGEVLKKIDKIDKCAFKMKFLAESDESEISKRYERNDKIVIYTSNEIDKERIISSIIDLKVHKPELFSNEKKLPLMPKVNGFIGCIRQGKSIVNTPLRNYVYADTYNSKLSKIMEDCMILSLREISARDENIFDATEGYYGNDPIEYLKTLKLMNSKQISQVVEIFKEELIESCQRSNLKIDVGKETPNQQR